MLFQRVLEQRSAGVREEVSLGDQRLLELLGIDVGAVSVRGKNALREATVFACFRILTDAVGKLPIKVHQETADGIRKASNHYLHHRLKLRPNPYMTTTTFFKTVEAQRNLHGNAYILPEFGTTGKMAGKVIALWPIDATKVQVWVDDVGLLGSANKLSYIVQVGGERRRLAADEIVHIKGLTTDGIVGIAPLDYLKYLVENGASATAYLNQFYRQGLQVKGLIQYVGDLTPDAQKRFKEKFTDMAAGLKNAHSVALMPIGYKFEPISQTMADAQFPELAQLNIRQIANAFGIKMHQLNDLSRATHSNIEEQQREFYVDTMQAIYTEYEQEMTYKLLLDSEIAAGYYLRFNVDAILRADIEKRFKAYDTAIKGTFMTPNQARALEEMPASEGGDVLLVNKAYIPLSMAGQPAKKEGAKAGQGKAEPQP